MGKAIVVKGLEVTNPLTTVTFLNVESILSEYYRANSTINASEKTALEAFVSGIVDAGLWDKVRYFYPMLGNSVDDMFIDVVSQQTEDIFNGTYATGVQYAGKTDGLSIVDRTLKAESRTSCLKSINTARLVNALDMADMALITSHTCHGSTASNFSAGSAFTLQRNSGNKLCIGIGIDAGVAYRSPYAFIGIDNDTVKTIPTNLADHDEKSYIERIIACNYDGTAATLYKDNNVFATATIYPVTVSENNYSLRALCSSPNWPTQPPTQIATDYNFFAITKHLTQAEWGVFYDLLLTFLKTVGKHS